MGEPTVIWAFFLPSFFLFFLAAPATRCIGLVWDFAELRFGSARSPEAARSNAGHREQQRTKKQEKKVRGMKDFSYIMLPQE